MKYTFQYALLNIRIWSIGYREAIQFFSIGNIVGHKDTKPVYAFGNLPHINFKIHNIYLQGPSISLKFNNEHQKNWIPFYSNDSVYYIQR